MSRLVLIDGSSYLYRAFHALPPLTAPDGTPTGALHGIVNMLRATLKENPDYAAFVVDAPGPTFRDALYPQYKAQRPPMPDDLRAQIEPMLAIVQALGFPLLRESGVEADDVIGTLALQAHARGIPVTISTSDKDFAQLVRPGITLTNTMSNTVMDEAGVAEKFGVRPDQVIDLLALMGDAVDNIPGVDKCGPKTAAKWLAEYGTLAAVMSNADKIGGKIGENLRAALDRLPLNEQLVTIKTDVELPVAATDLKLKPRDVEALRELYSRLGFNQALRELDGGAAAGGVARSSAPAATPARDEAAPDPALAAKGEYECVTTREQLAAWVARLHAAELIAFDTETDALDAMRANLVGLSFAVEPGRACYIPVGHRGARTGNEGSLLAAADGDTTPLQLSRDEVLDALRPIFTDPRKRKLGQHGKYDLHVLRRHGITVQGYSDDTMLASFVWQAGLLRHDMDSLAQRLLGYATIKYEDVAGKGAKQISFAEVALDKAVEYAAEDADITLRLHRVLSAKLASEPSLQKVYREIEMPLVPVLERIEYTGVLIDADELKRQSADLSQRMLATQQRAFEIAGRSFN
ncbi:MAG TPA: 5'-3' exonuclease H3TH domain-containing protein, partial [Arenimonas sp.]|nr:5'-3' exonuclease H3TH domain-containing protein [Arenimonas sp.]